MANDYASGDPWFYLFFTFYRIDYMQRVPSNIVRPRYFKKSSMSEPIIDNSNKNPEKKVEKDMDLRIKEILFPGNKKFRNRPYSKEFRK